MAVNLRITYRDFPAPMLADERIRERVEKLERMYPRMVSLNVLAEQIERRHHKGKLYLVRLDAQVPGGELVVNRRHADKRAHEDFFVAMRDSFTALESQLKTFRDKQNDDVKHHETPPHGTVKAVFPDHGFIETPDGREIYFHANSVVDGKFKDLDVGAAVRFAAVDNESDKGPQATTVHPIGKHHLV